MAKKTTGALPEVDGYITMFESPESHLVARAEYDRDTNIMLLTLKDTSRKGREGEKVYRYSIPENLWNEFTTAASKGRFFSQVIRPSYAGRPVL